MPKPKGTTGGRLINLTSRIYAILVWLLSRVTPNPTELGFTASEQELFEARHHQHKFVMEVIVIKLIHRVINL